MALSHFFRKGGIEVREYKRALKKAKEAIEVLCEISEEMEDEYGYDERDEHSEGYEERSSSPRRVRVVRL